MQHVQRNHDDPARFEPLHRLERTPGFVHRLLIVALAMLTLAGCGPFGGQAANHRSPPVPTVPPRFTAYVPAQGGYALNSISMVSASDGWAVGSAQGSQDPLIVHYTNGQWQKMDNPSGKRVLASASWLTQVVMVSASEGWAVGGFTDFGGHTFGLILHYTGGLWSPQMIPNVYLSGLAMLSSQDGWMVGSTSLTPGPSQKGVLWHYTDGAWKSVSAFGSALSHIVMTSPSNGWMVGQTVSSGSTQAAGPSLWRYNGKNWAATTVPVMDTITSLSLRSASDGWAIGFKNPSGSSAAGNESVFAHYDGQTWTTVQTMQHTTVTDVSLDGPNDGWAVGAQADAPNSNGVAASHNLYLHNTGGQWTAADGPAENGGLQAVFMRSASDGWAVEGNGAILRYQLGGWQVVVSAAA